MAILIKAKNNNDGSIRTFTASDWYNYQKTGYYTYLQTINGPEPSEQTEPIQIKPIVNNGCGCGNKKR